jgi:ribosomal protein S21
MYNITLVMPIIIKANKGDNTRDLIKRFKKAVATTDIVTVAKNRRFHVKPAQARNILKSEKRRLKKKIRSLKKMKNVPNRVIVRLTERLTEGEK